MSYTVEIHSNADKDLESLPRNVRTRVLDAIEGLAGDPRPRGHKKLRGNIGADYRIRVGDYRILYDIDDGVLRVLVVTIAHRRESYR